MPVTIGRRELLATLGAAWPFGARGQPSSRRAPIVGVLWHAGNAEEEAIYLCVLQKAFSDLGYIEGKNSRIEHRFPAEKPERFRILAQELVEAKCDAIIAVTALGAVELKNLPALFLSSLSLWRTLSVSGSSQASPGQQAI